MRANSPVVLAIPRHLNFLAPIVFDDLVRVGKRNDGGYILPRFLLAESDCLLSLGIDDDWSFESQFLANHPGLTIQAYDHTVSRTILNRNLARACRGLLALRSDPRTIFRKARAAFQYSKFFTGNSTHHQERVSGSKESHHGATVETMFARIHSNKVFAKIDIEGSEYEIIAALLEHAARINAIVIEFHDTARRRELFVDAVARLRERYVIAHIHGNNHAPVAPDHLPEVLEMTFVRKDFRRGTERRSRLPLPELDQPNNRRGAEYAIIFDLT